MTYSIFPVTKNLSPLFSLRKVSNSPSGSCGQSFTFMYKGRWGLEILLYATPNLASVSGIIRFWERRLAQALAFAGMVLPSGIVIYQSFDAAAPAYGYILPPASRTSSRLISKFNDP